MQRSSARKATTKTKPTLQSTTTPHHRPKRQQRRPTQTTTTRSFANYYDSASAVAPSRPRGPKSQQTQTKNNSSKSRYEMIRSQQQAQDQQQAAGGARRQGPGGNTQQQQQQQQQRPSSSSPGQKLSPNSRPFNNNNNKADNSNDPKRTEASPTDFDSVFKNSKLTNVFSGTPTHQSFWNRMNDGDTVYLVGTRRLVDPHGNAQDNNFCLLQRTVDKQLNQIHDRLVALDYESGMPFEQYLSTSLETDLCNATAVDKDQESGAIISRTFLRLRGEPWQWHSGVAMSKIEPRVPATMSQEFLDSLPETFAISRMKFGENGIIAEKLIKQNNRVVLTIVDDLKITTKAIFTQKAEKIFNDYSQMLAEQLEKNADNFDGRGEGADETAIDPSMFQGGSGLRPKM